MTLADVGRLDLPFCRTLGYVYLKAFPGTLIIRHLVFAH
jgi:hypothetical protein